MLNTLFKRSRAPGHTRRGAALALFLLMGPAVSGPLTISVTQARNDAGLVRCGLFDRADGWRQEDQALRTVNTAIDNNKAVCAFGVVPEGEYAVAVFHAEHGESRIDYGFLGKPKQGVGFSNNPSITFGAPDFSAAKVRVGASPLQLEIVLKY